MSSPADRGGVSRPSVKACTTVGTPAPARIFASATAWSWCECTPPGETRPTRWQVPPLCRSRAIRSRSAGAFSISRSAIASVMRGRSCITRRPAPMLRCPTSELPIWPGGRPTSLPDVCRKARGQVAHRRSKLGVRAWRTALSAASSRQPQPSNTTSITGRRCCGISSSFVLHRRGAQSPARPP